MSHVEFNRQFMGGSENASVMPEKYLLTGYYFGASNPKQARWLGIAFKKMYLASGGKILPKQKLLMKSQNDSTSGMSFIFIYFGKKFGC